MGFQIREARESDWSLIVERTKETVWRSLSAPRREELEKGLVAQRLKGLISELKSDRDRPHQAFVARDEGGGFAGYIWLTENTDYFTGQKQAFILEIYVEEKQRRKGLGQRFLELAERWGRERGYRFIALSVAAPNLVARGLYEKRGYQEERVGMSKRLL